MWSVRQGRLFCGAEMVAVRRVVVELVAARADGLLSPEKARTMIRMERALSLQGLCRLLAAEAPPA